MHRRYCLWVIGTVLTTGAILATTNALMDPYALFGTTAMAGVSSIKPEVVKNDRAAKAQMIARRQPAALILGNSRSLNGIPTRHPAWEGLNVFNAAFTAGRLGEALEVLKFAHEQHRVERVLLNIDELNFRAGGDPGSRYDQRRYSHGTAGSWVRAADRAQALLTDQGLRASIRTWNARHGRLMESDAAVILPDGSVDQEIFFNAIERRGGARKAFTRVELQVHQPRPAPQRSPSEAQEEEVASAAAEAELLALIEYCRKERIHLSIYLPPLHARALASMQLAGTLEALLRVRKSVLKVVEREAGTSAKQPIRVLDFLSLHRMTMEPIPAAGDASSRMTWFFEGSHFTQRFGARILDTVYSSPDQTTEVDHHIGSVLKSATLEERFAELQYRLAQWMNDNPVEVSELRQTIAGNAPHPVPTARNAMDRVRP